jgi:hypothetical protein
MSRKKKVTITISHEEKMATIRELLLSQARVDMEDTHMFHVEKWLTKISLTIPGASDLLWEFKNQRHVIWTPGYYFVNSEGIIPCNYNLTTIVQIANNRVAEINDRIKHNPALYITRSGQRAPSNAFNKRTSLFVDGKYFPLLMEAYRNSHEIPGIKHLREAMRADPTNPKWQSYRELLGLPPQNLYQLTKEK